MKYKTLVEAIISAIHPNEPQPKGTVWEPKSRADELEAEALEQVGYAKQTTEAVTAKTVSDGDDDGDDELAYLLDGNVTEVNEAIDAAFDDLSAEQLEALSELEAKGKNRKGVLDHIASYLDAE